MTDLTYISEEDLLAELFRRWDTILFVAVKEHTDTTDLRRCTYLGGWVTALGLTQSADHFETVREDVWLAIQRRAARLLADGGGDREMHQHWRDIIDGKVPFGMRLVKQDGTHCDAYPLI